MEPRGYPYRDEVIGVNGHNAAKALIRDWELAISPGDQSGALLPHLLVHSHEVATKDLADLFPGVFIL